MRVETIFEDGVAVITSNQPERKNAITLDMRTEIEHAFLKAQDDNDVCAIVLTGAGSNFSAGADLSEGSGDGGRGSLYRMRLLHPMARGVAGNHKTGGPAGAGGRSRVRLGPGPGRQTAGV